MYIYVYVYVCVFYICIYIEREHLLEQQCA